MYRDWGEPFSISRPDSNLETYRFVRQASGELESVQEVVEHLADGLTATQMQFLRRAIDELPARVRDKIDIAGRKDQPDL